MLAKTWLQILILPDCTQHEAYALGLVANEQQDTVADHAMAQQGRSVVEEHQIEPIARDLSTERTRQAPDRVLVRRGIRRVLLTEQYRDVDVALAPRAAARPASVQPGETHRGVVAQAVCEPVAKAGNVSFAGESGHARLPLESAFPTVVRTRWPMLIPGDSRPPALISTIPPATHCSMSRSTRAA